MQTETKRKEIRDKRNKQEEEEISRTQDEEHKKNDFNSLPLLRKQQPGGLGQWNKHFNVDVIRRVFIDLLFGSDLFTDWWVGGVGWVERTDHCVSRVLNPASRGFETTKL